MNLNFFQKTKHCASRVPRAQNCDQSVDFKILADFFALKITDWAGPQRKNSRKTRKIFWRRRRNFFAEMRKFRKIYENLNIFATATPKIFPRNFSRKFADGPAREFFAAAKAKIWVMQPQKFFAGFKSGVATAKITPKIFRAFYKKFFAFLRRQRPKFLCALFAEILHFCKKFAEITKFFQ